MTVRDSWTGRNPWCGGRLNSGAGTSYLGVGMCHRSQEEIPMTTIVPHLRYSAKQHLLKQLRRCRNAGLKTRYLIILNLVNGRSAAATADVLSVGRSTVYAVAQRFRAAGEAGLVDRREDNGPRKLDERYLATLY